MAATALTDAGFAVETVADAAQALHRMQEQSFDIAVFDVMMPTLPGLELITKVRHFQNNRHLPVIVITGNDDTDSISRAFDAGATSVLSKPLNWPLFVQHVNFVLRAANTEGNLRDAIRRYAPDAIDQSRAALREQHQDDLRTTAHAFKSSSANLGASRLAQLCFKLETRLAQETICNTDANERSVSNIAAEFDAVASVLEQPAFNRNRNDPD